MRTYIYIYIHNIEWVNVCMYVCMYVLMCFLNMLSIYEYIYIYTHIDMYVTDSVHTQGFDVMCFAMSRRRRSSSKGLG